MEGNLVIVEEESGEEEDFDGEPLYSIMDEQIQNKAHQTLPKIFGIAPIPRDATQFGVFALCPVPYRTQFGPLDAPLVAAYTLPPASFLLKSKVKCPGSVDYFQESYLYYDISDEKQCNWMSVVKPANNFEEQNLIAHLVKDQVYFTTTRNVAINEELKVWYAPKYASFVGAKVYTPVQHQPTEINESCNNIRTLGRASKSPSYDYFEGDFGLDDRNVPPKKRGWKRATHQLSKIHGKSNESPATNFEAARNKINELSSNPTVVVPSSAHKPTDLQTTSTSNNSRPIKTFPCSECGKTFYKKYTLKMHRATHSSTCNFLCHTCGKGFKRNDKLKDHIKRVHHPPKARKTPNSNVRRFVPRLQPKEYDKFLYKCLKCSLGFIKRGMLVNHMLKQHPESDIKTIPELSIPIIKNDISYKCLYCDKSYKTNAKRKRHIEKHHAGKPVPPDCRKKNQAKEGVSSNGYITVKPINCPHCLSEYSSKSKMLKHVQAKHTAKPLDVNKEKDQANTAALSVTENSAPASQNHLQFSSLPGASNNQSLEPALGSVDNSFNVSQDICNTVDNNNIAFWNNSNNTQFESQGVLSTAPVTQPLYGYVEQETLVPSHPFTNQQLPTVQLTSYSTSHCDGQSDQLLRQRDQNEATSTVPNAQYQIQQRQESTAIQKNLRQLPLTYSRGRKQLLLPFCNDRLFNPSNYDTRQMYSATSSAIEKQSNTGTTATGQVEIPEASNQRNGLSSENQQFTTLSPAQPIKEPSNSQSTVSATLSYQDWMY